VDENERKICDLEITVAKLKQKSDDDDKALVLAKDVAAARWTAVIALLLALINLAVQFMRR
jgi:hypothetical protein